MANAWHVQWLKEGVNKWNKRRKRIEFEPDLSELNFFDILPDDFRDAPKTSRYFEKIDLSDSNLAGADLSRLNFQRAKFDGASLAGADLTRSNFELATFVGSDLRNPALKARSSTVQSSRIQISAAPPSAALKLVSLLQSAFKFPMHSANKLGHRQCGSSIREACIGRRLG